MAARASWSLRRWLRSWWPVLLFSALAFLVGVAFGTQTAFVFISGVMMGLLVTKAWT